MKGKRDYNLKHDPETLFSNAWGEFQLERYPLSGDPSLRAWDAADAYLLSYIRENIHALTRRSESQPRVWIYNDGFGALCIPLNSACPTSISDSYLSHRAQQKNLLKNACDPDSLTVITSVQKLPEFTPDYVFFRIPKSLSLLEEQLQKLAARVSPSTKIIAASMTKYLHTSTLQLFETLIGPTYTSLAKKKARLLFCHPESNTYSNAESTWPKVIPSYDGGPEMVNHANVFSRDKFDIGSRFFVANFPKHAHQEKVLDLGCGNGILGTAFQQSNANAELYFVDESYMAVRSSEETFKRTHPKKKAHFFVGNGLRDLQHSKSINGFDLVLCNPPFHQQQTIGPVIGNLMFQDAAKALKKTGELWVIGNRHLAYHIALKRSFHKVERVAKNKKFMIYCATKAKNR